MSLNLEQEFPLDMFPEIICSFIQHGLMITATIHSFWTFQIRSKFLVALFFRLPNDLISSNTCSPWHWSSSARQRAQWLELRQSNAYSTQSRPVSKDQTKPLQLKYFTKLDSINPWLKSNEYD